MSRSAVTAIVLLLSALRVGPAAAQVTVEGIVEPNCGALPRPDAADASRWVIPIQRTGTRFLRLRFEATDLAGDKVTLIVRDLRGNVTTIALDQLQSAPRRWTRILEGDRAEVEVSGATSGRVRVDCVVQKAQPRVFSVIPPNDLKPLWEFAREPGIVAAARSVAKLSFMTDTFPGSCTGFMISNDLMVTNAHCVDSQERCDTAMALFGYEATRAGVLRVAAQEDCLEYIQTELSAFDVSVLRLSGAPGAPGRYGHLAFRELDLPTVPEDLLRATAGLFVVSHPGGLAKMVTKAQCAIKTALASGSVAARESDFGHVCDVSDGSSGAPLLDATNRIVGIHHLGFDKAGRWRDENRAVRVDVVRDVLKRLAGAPHLP
jgi:hypothetical protein